MRQDAFPGRPQFHWACGGNEEIWRHSVVECHGTRIGVRFNHPELEDDVRRCLLPGWRLVRAAPGKAWISLVDRGPAERQRFGLRSGSRRPLWTPSRKELVERLESEIHHAVAVRARDGLFVHAAVVGWLGRAILIPGRTHSGKTSLAMELVRQGASYYSDEYAVVDAAGYIHPFPRAIRPRPRLDGEPVEAPAVSYEQAAQNGPLAPGLIVATRFRAGGRWRPAPMTAGEALLALVRNTVAVRRDPARAIGTLRRVVRGTPAFCGVRGEAAATASALLNLIESHLTKREEMP
ncbi:MAG: hypothetical protein ACK5AZ_12160 [Bryobacteraceae bacterium]